ncbi:hypothetical protein [Nocardioides flavescens]|uniref:Uncharacterized protein n=1 Tax=Nocardioides flavescens TaxID=2691959 RepID=A0A6L7F4D4_9ACTN|nr:hypothetical protein [Nocardioides flavescens]MXG92075.1 hypothetical protein [Nocardioides flavescens]
MDSWRDTASQQAQDDLDGLLPLVLDFAKQQLDNRGAFYPYAAVVGTDGVQRMTSADVGSDKPESAELLSLLTEGLIGDRDQLRATAIVTDVHVAELNSDAVRVALEHREGVALTVLMPYRITRFRRGAGYADMQASRGDTVIWAG